MAAESAREAELQKQVDDLQQLNSIDDILARVDARGDDEGGER